MILERVGLVMNDEAGRAVGLFVMLVVSKYPGDQFICKLSLNDRILNA